MKKIYIGVISGLLCVAAVTVFYFIKGRGNTIGSTDVAENYIIQATSEPLASLEILSDFKPEDLYSLSSAKLVVKNDSYSPLEETGVDRLAAILSNAKEIGFVSGCPFDAALKLTKSDGQVITLMLAADSCAVYKYGDKCYDYSDGDNSELLSMFGLTADELACIKK